MNQQHSQHPLHLAVEDLKTLPTIDINGKSYTQVASRIVIFRKYFPEYSVVTNILHDDEYRVVVQTKITSPNGIIIATGLAEEFRRDNNPINTTSALENAETSSIGRALACLSLGGSEYASANEVENAISLQEQIKQNNKPQNQQDYQNQTPNQNVNNSQTQGKSFDHYEYSSLYNLGLNIVEKNGFLVIAGENQYAYRDAIKACFFKFDPKTKTWWKEQGAA